MPLIFYGRIGAAVQDIHLRVPKVLIRFVVLRQFLLLSLKLGQSFLFLIPHPGGLVCRLTTDENRGSRNQRNELKVFHI
jgi:hypothetical protein